MKLFYSETLNPRKACAVAKYLGSPVEYVHVDLAKMENRTPQFLGINPNGKVPVLQDGETTLWEANAIMCHLARVAGSDLWPKDERQIEVMRWLSWDANHFTRFAGGLYFQNLIKPQFGFGSPDAAVVQEAEKWVRQHGSVLNNHLRGREYLVGDALTVADFAVAVTLPYADKARIPVGDFPEIVRWHARLNDLPAWRDPFPHNRAEAA
jgi:glutathione S-transferase